MRPSEEVVDGEVVGYGDTQQVGPSPGVTVIGQVSPTGTQPGSTSVYVPPGVDLQAYLPTSDSRGRAMALFVEVPLLAYIALHPQLSGLIRLAAAGLGVYRVSQVLKPGQYELQITVPESM